MQLFVNVNKFLLVVTAAIYFPCDADYLMISHFNSMAVVQLSKHSHKCCFDVCQYQKCVENVWGKSNSISHKSNRKHFDTPSMNNIKPMRTTDSWN